MTGKRKRYGAEFKARIALEALRGEVTAAQLATKHGTHHTMVGEWKKQVMEGLTSLFSGKEAAQDTVRLSEAEVEELHAKIGQLVVERDFWPRPLADEPGGPHPTPLSPGATSGQVRAGMPGRPLGPTRS